MSTSNWLNINLICAIINCLSLTRAHPGLVREEENRTFVNAKLVEEGYAQVMGVPPNVKHLHLFLK